MAQRRADRGRRRLPAGARPEGEPRRAARRQRAARHLGLRAAAGRLRRPGVARRGDGAAHLHPGGAAPHGAARARQAPAPGPGPGGGGPRLRRRRRPHAGRVDRGATDRLGERRRVAAAAALGPDAPTEAPLPRRPSPRGAPLSRRRWTSGPTWPRSTARSRSPPWHPSRPTPPCRSGWPPRPPSTTGPSPRGRCTGWPTACPLRATRGRPRRREALVRAARAGPAGRRQDGVARPARPAGAADPGMVGRAQQAAAQRLPHLHRRPASARGGGAGRRADRHGRAARPAPRRRAAARHRQGLPRRPHDGRHGGRRPHRDRAWASRPPTSRCWSTWCATTSCCPTPPPGATSTTPRPSPRVASAAATAVTLHLLAALTEADSRATGPSAWGAWKAGLVADLVERTDRAAPG